MWRSPLTIVAITGVVAASWATITGLFKTVEFCEAHRKSTLCVPFLGLLSKLPIASESPNPSPSNISIPGRIKYGGSTSFADINFAEASKNPEEEQRYKWFKDRGLDLLYKKPSGANPGSKTGFKMLLNDDIHILQSSESLENLKKDENLIKKLDKSELNKISTLEEKQVASDAIVFYVSKNSKIYFPANLAIQQLGGVLSRDIPNWEGVNITVHVRNIEDSGTVEYIKQKIMGGKDFGKGETLKKINTDSIQSVSKDPTGIGFATAGETCKQKTIRVLSINNVNPCTKKTDTNFVNLSILEDGTYPKQLIRPLYIIYQSSDPTKQAGDAYVNVLRSDEGKKFVKKAGLIPFK
jgi:phosphate transport system substrate-binding protein